VLINLAGVSSPRRDDDHDHHHHHRRRDDNKDRFLKKVTHQKKAEEARGMRIAARTHLRVSPRWGSSLINTGDCPGPYVLLTVRTSMPRRLSFFAFACNDFLPSFY